MISRTSRFVLSLLNLACTALLLIPSALAQSAVAEVTVTHIEAQAEETGEVLVSAFVSVLDAAGQPVSSLTAADFTLSENNLPIEGQLLSISPATDPLAVTLLIDTSSSMAQPGPDGVRAIDAAKDAAVAFIETLQEGDQAAVYEFNSQARRQQDFTFDHNLAIDEGVLQLDVGEVETACLPDALLQVIDTLAVKPEGRRIVIALTGNPENLASETCSGATVDDVLEGATTVGNSIPIFSVAFGNNLDEEELLRLGRRSGGRTLLAPDSTGLTGLLTTLSTQLKNQYKISYPTQAPVGLARIFIFENSSEQSDRRQVLIPTPIEPTPTPLPQFTIDLAIEQPTVDKVIIKVEVPENVALEKTELYLNNKLIEKIVSSPFDEFAININDLGSGKHNIRVEAVDENGVTASAEVELTLTIPPTPVPTLPPTSQPTTVAAATSPDEAELTIPTLALTLIIAGLVLLLIFIGLFSYFLFFRAKRPVFQALPPAPPPLPSSSILTVDDEAGDHTIVDYYPTPAKKENQVHQAALIVSAGHPALSQAKFSLDKSEIKIGRNNKEFVNDIPIEDKAVSRSHAQIVYRNRQYFIQDLGSTTGTSVNGVKLKAFQERMLQNGTEVAIGPKVKFKFVSMQLPQAPDVTMDDYIGDKFRTEEDSDDDPHRTLFDYEPRK